MLREPPAVEPARGIFLAAHTQAAAARSSALALAGSTTVPTPLLHKTGRQG